MHSDAAQSTTSTDRPLRADARRNRARILEAARAVFAVSGADAQMDAIAARAGVGVGTVYRHFPTKEVLVSELVRERFEGFREAARVALTIEDPWEAFASFLRDNAAQCAADVGTQHAFFQSNPEVGRRLAAEIGLLELSQRLIARGQAAGVIRPDFRAEDIGMVMCGVAGSMVHGRSGWDWQRHLGFVLDGLRAQPD